MIVCVCVRTCARACVHMCVHVHVYACESACVCACVRARVRAFTRARVCAFSCVRAWFTYYLGDLASGRASATPSDPPALRSKVNEIQRGLLHGQVHLHADKHTVQNVAMTITTALEEAVSRMQLQLHSLPMKRWRKRKSAGGNRHLQDAKKHARNFSLEKVAGGGLANSRC